MTLKAPSLFALFTLIGNTPGVWSVGEINKTAEGFQAVVKTK